MALRPIVQRKTPEAAEATRLALRRAAIKKGQKLDPRSLIAAEFMILGTSLPKKGHTAKEILVVYRLRWQIELTFKRLKSLLPGVSVASANADEMLGCILISCQREPKGDREVGFTPTSFSLCCVTASARISWNLPPEDLLDADYVPSLWAVQKIALLVLIFIILGPMSLVSVTEAGPLVQRNLANAPRKRKPHVRYPVRGLF